MVRQICEVKLVKLLRWETHVEFQGFHGQEFKVRLLDSWAQRSGAASGAASPIVSDFNEPYPLVNIQKTMENCHLWLIYLVKIVIFHSYVNVYQRVS